MYLIQHTEIMTRVLVVGGGAVLASAYVGFLHAVEQMKPRVDSCKQWRSFDAYYGSSAGALFAALLAAGVTSKQMENLLERNPPGSLFLDLGASLRTVLAACGLDLTMQEFRKRHGNLHVVATDMGTGQPLVLHADSHPQLPLRDALCASCAIPFVVPPRYIHLNEVRDGCISSPVPMDCASKEFPGATLLVLSVSTFPAEALLLPFQRIRRLEKELAEARGCVCQVVDVVLRRGVASIRECRHAGEQAGMAFFLGLVPPPPP